MMGLLDRVSTLVRANLNNLVERAENPSTMIKQVILDMENQLLQVKTQVAVSIADQHMLETKARESADKAAEWLRKAELAIAKGHDDLARAALARHKSAERTTASFRQQVEDQTAQVAALKTAFITLEKKLAETRAKCDVLLAQHRRARALDKANQARLAMRDRSESSTFARMADTVSDEEVVSRAKTDLRDEDLEHRFAHLEWEEEIDRLLDQLKAKKGVTG